MGSLSIIDKQQNHCHLRHFVVQTRTFQIEKARDVSMYENLRVYIKRQNEKRKQEMEMSAELKRARREKELKHKRDKSTLGDIKEELTKYATKLNELENEKHALFMEFKRVLNVDSTRKSEIDKKQKETAAAYQNLTFGPVKGDSSGNQKQLSSSHSSSQSTPIMPANAHSNILPNSLHHLQPIQPMFFSQPPSSSSSSVTTSSAAPPPLNPHRSIDRNARMPPSSTATSKPNAPPVTMMPKTLSSHVPLTSIPSSVSASPSLVPASVSSQFQNDRHRASFKRSHEQASSSPMQTSAIPGPITTAPPSHMHYMANYKPQLGPQHPIPSAPYGAGQHIIPNLEQLNHPLYQSFLSSYHGNPMNYMNSTNPKYQEKSGRHMDS